MNFINQIHDAFRYTLRDWKAIVLLGMIICISDTAMEYNTENIYLVYLTLIIFTILFFFEEGYRFKIITETLNGKNHPPRINNISNIIKEGFIEVFTITTYVLLNTILIFLCLTILDVDNFTGGLIVFCFTQIMTLLVLGSPIYKALHGCKFKSGFNVIGIMKLYYKMSLSKFIIMMIVLLVCENIIFSVALNRGVFETHHILEFIFSFFLAPILLLFETRLISICGKETIPNQN